MRRHDWSTSPLGPPSEWPPALLSTVNLLLNSRFPMFVASGPELGFLYNDAYAEILGRKHPDALGRPFRAIWSEIWSDISPLIDKALSGEATWSENLPLTMNRHGYDEQTWFTFSYSPLRDETGRVIGVFCACTETTARLRAEDALRATTARLEFLDRLGSATATATDADDILATTTRLVGEYLGVSNCAYADMDADGDGFTIRGNWHRSNAPSILGHYSLAAFGQLAVEKLNAGQALVINDNLSEIAPHEAATFQAIGIAATICMPLVRQGRLVALMAIHHAEPHRWTDGEISLIREVAERCWAHIERVGVEAKLRESEVRFRTMADDAPVMTWITDETGSCVYLNRQWYDFTGQTEAEAIGFGWTDAVHPDDRDWSRDVFLKANAESAAFRLEYRLRRADGVYRWALDAAHPRIDAQGRHLGYFGSVVDIDDLRQAEERLRTLTDAVPAFVWFASPDGQLHFLNDRWAGYTGMSVPDSLPDRWLQAVHPDDRERTAEVWASARARGVTYEVEVRYRRHDGAYRWYVARAEPLRDPGGTITTWFGTSTDIHDHKLAEERLQELNETLETRVSERTSDLIKAEEALRQSQKMEAIGQLTGGVAHDFNNMLTIIRSSVDFLRRPDLAEARRSRYLDSVSDTVDRAAKLTGQLLAFARRQALKPVAFDVCERLRSVADLLDTVTGARIAIVTRLPDRPCFIRADISQFETALVNIAVNARDAMQGEGTLTISLAGASHLPDRLRGEGEGPFAAISLADTGAGIPPEVQGRIFEPFFTTKEVGKGTGLGLSQVFGFARQSGGDVGFTSVPGEGTVFTLYLPEAEAPAQPEAGGESEGMQAHGAGQRVLVVEDNLEVGRFATQIIEDLGYVTAWAITAEEALALLGREGEVFDAVFSDVVMPGMGGVELARRLASERPGLPVILATGYSDALAEQGAEGLRVLLKPYSAAQIAQALHEALRSKRSEAGAR